MKKIIIILLLAIVVAGFVAADMIRNYTITQLPFNDTQSVPFGGVPNTSLSILCDRNLAVSATACIYTSPSSYNISFTNTSLVELDFFIFVPEDAANEYVNEEYSLFINGTIPVQNFSLIFSYNISVNATNESNTSNQTQEPPRDPARINITSITPGNNSFIGQFDQLPTEIVVKYDGDLDTTESDLRLFLNGSHMDYVLDLTVDGEVKYILDVVPEGRYTGNWFLVDSQGRNKTYNYEFAINQEPPPVPLSVYPDRGIYRNDVVTMRVQMDHTSYTMYYMVTDGMAPLGGNWKLMSFDEQEYFILNFDFYTAGIGQLYFKIVDQFDNIRVYPTGVISGPSLKLDVEDRSKSIEPGDTIILDVEVEIKPGSGNILKCKMDDFITNEDDDDEHSWSIRNVAEIMTADFDEDDDNSDDDIAEVIREYDETIILPEGTRSEELELKLLIPRNVVIDETYDSALYCIVS